MTVQLRDYQIKAVNDVRASFAAGNRSVLLVSPVGSGKTTIFSYISAGIYRKNKRVWIIAHRRELLRQISETLAQFQIPHAVLSGGYHGVPNAQVLVASVFTLVNRIKHMPPPHLIIGDEAHHFTLNSSWGKIVTAFPSAKILGVTASPVRLDGKGLGDVFNDMVMGPTVAELTARGFLSPAIVYAPAKPDLSGLKRRAGDYVTGEIEDVMDKPKITGSAVKHYQRYADGKRAVAFCCSIAHAEHTAEQFRAAGYVAAHVDGKMDDRLRDQTIAAFKRGQINVLTSCDLINEGFDCLDDQTEILTPSGWRGIGAVQKGDTVYSFNKETWKVEETVALSYGERFLRVDEKMVSIRSQHMDIRVTEGHTIIYRTLQPYRIDGRSPDVRSNEAGNIVQRQQPFVIPISAHAEQAFPGVPLTDDEISLLGWFMTDGTIRGSTVSIAQAKEPYVDEIRRLIHRIGMDFKEQKRVTTAGAYSVGREYSVFHIPKGTHSGSLTRRGWGYMSPYFDKDVCPLLHRMTREQFVVFWEAMMKGDGTKQEGKSGTLTVSSKKQADAYMQMAVLRGFAVMYGTYRTKNNFLIYNMRVRDQQWHSLAPKDARGAKFTLESLGQNEKVWCVSNRNGTLITRRNGKIAILGNCPNIECGILLRPTQSLGLYIQQTGRSVRISPGKTHTIILDHAGNTAMHGLIDEVRDWSLDGSVHRASDGERAAPVRTCPQCFAMHRPAPACPRCSYVYPANGREVEHVDGDLELQGDGIDVPQAVDPERLEQKIEVLVALGKRRGMKKPREWAFHVLCGQLAAKRAQERDVPHQGLINGLTEAERNDIWAKVKEVAA